MGRHLLIGILIALLSGGGCARPGLTVRSERGIAPADLQRVRPVEYAERDLKEAVAPYAGHLAWVARQQESRLRLRLASDWATPADPAQRALVDAYLGWCADRGGAGDCLEVLDQRAPGLSIDAKRTIALRMALASGLREAADAVRDINPIKVEALLVIWFTGYLATLLLPEVVTKVLFVLMTTNLIAFLGFDGFHNILEGYRVMRDEAAAAQTFEKLQEAGERYGGRMGPSVVRIVTALVTWGLSSATGMARPVSGLPGAAQAAANARAQGFELAAVSGGSVTVSSSGAVTLVLATEATMPQRGGASKQTVVDSPEQGRPDQSAVVWESPPTRVLHFTERNLQKGFTKHGADFGLRGNWNSSRAEEFRNVVNQHINSPGVRVIAGTYRGDPVVHYVDPRTGLNVVADRVGNYVSGWRLGAEQLESVLATGRLF